jgi:hypothetical protein
MSETGEGSTGDTSHAAADNHADTEHAHPADTDLADQPPAEPMSRDEYADHMRQEPAAGIGDDGRDEYGTGLTDNPGEDYGPDQSDPPGQAQDMAREEYADHMRQGPAAEADDEPGPGQGTDATSQPGDTGNEPRRDDPAEQAQGMTRSEYADYMQQGTAAGDDGPGSPGTEDHDPSGEPGTSHPPGDTEASRVQDPGEVERTVPSHKDGPHQPPPGQDAYERAAPSRESEDSWPPPRGDQDRARKLYSEYVADMAEADSKGGRDQGASAIGPKPDRSPGDISDLPPPGDKLAEMESSKKSRFEGLLQEAEKEENLDDLHDAIEEDANTIQGWLSARPPEGHAEQPVPTSSPYIAPWAPDHGIEAGSAASAVMVAGILTIHMVRWIDDKLRHRKGDQHVSNG